MQSPVKLRLYCSICARNDYYMDRIRAAADQLGLDYTLEKVTDDEELNRLDLTVPCLYAYCPGCRILNEQVLSDEPEARCTPRWRSMGSFASGAFPPATRPCWTPSPPFCRKHDRQPSLLSKILLDKPA